MTRAHRLEPSETWADIKQVGWGFLMVAPFIAVFAFGARVLVGGREALWLGIAIMGIALVCYGSVVVASLVGSYAVEAITRLVANRGGNATGNASTRPNRAPLN